MRGLVTILALAAVVYGLAALLVWRFQARFIYYPSEPTRRIEASPADIGLAFEDLQLVTEDEIALHGWFVPGPTETTLLFFHGNAGNISHRLDSLRLFNQLGYSVLMIDYRGYGRSDGEPGEQGTYLDAMAAWQHLVGDRGLRPEQIIVFGRSLGGAIAAQLSSVVKPAGLILESTFASVPAMARHTFPWLPSRLARIRYDTLARIGAVACPILLLHSPDDEIIPFDQARQLQRAAAPGTRLIELQGGHNDAFIASGSAYPAAISQFVDGVVAGPPG